MHRKMGRTRSSDALDTNNAQLLIKYSTHNQVDQIKQLGATARTLNKVVNNTTPLITACQVGAHETVDVLINYGALRNFSLSDGWTPLMACAEWGRVECAKRLLHNLHQSQKLEMVGSILSPDGWTPLLIACHHGKQEMVDFLLKNGADPRTETTDNGWTALMSASYRGPLDTLKLLLREPLLDVNQAKDDGGVALMCAAYSEHQDICRELLENGADTNILMLGGISALMLAVEEGSLECCRLLCSYGANVEVKNTVDGMSALDLAKDLNNSKISSYLSWCKGMSQLQLAVQARERKLIRRILSSNQQTPKHNIHDIYRSATSVNEIFGLPVDPGVVSDIRAALLQPFKLCNSHLFPRAFVARISLLFSVVSLPADLWIYIISFLYRDD
mmetsp:Transcript_9624/g.18137  ORF Transcript_9624/g.18137 Transcript_9624/m.18137 type:complete len:389 (+) Transcript_9624:212-1378(+)